MTTTIIRDISTTITSTLTTTQTDVVKGVLDLSVQTSGGSGSSGITSGKAVSDSGSTISTITSSSTSTSSASSPTSSHINFGHNLLTQGTTASSGNNSKIGMAIGIPVAIIGSVLLVVALYFYLRSRRNYAQSKDAKLHSLYDEKYNYKKSSFDDSASPYNLKTVYQFKKPPSYRSSSIGNNAQTSTGISTTYSVPSIKELPQGQDNSMRWQTPIHQWFNNMSKSAISSRASLSTGIFTPKTPAIALREFNMKNQQQHQFEIGSVNERSPILPTFPEKSYCGDGSFSHSSVQSSPDRTIKQQVVQTDTTRPGVILQHPSKLAKNKKNNHTVKPLPEVPPISSVEPSIKSLVGLEQIVVERMIPDTPKVDFSKYKNDKVYIVKKNYEKNLADELSITVGEFVKILARHTDGWCLIEKCDRNGKVLNEDTNNYINEGRGVIPELCLQAPTK